MALHSSHFVLSSSSSSSLFCSKKLDLSSYPPSSISLPLFNSQPKLHASKLIFRTDAVSLSSTIGVGEDLPADYDEWLPKLDPIHRRRAGILLHPTSFRGPYGIGDLGEEAFRFIDWLHDAGCSVWQVVGGKITYIFFKKIISFCSFFKYLLLLVLCRSFPLCLQEERLMKKDHHTQARWHFFSASKLLWLF